ncbi:MAG: SLATT domain-containing protein [Limnospira sp.]
MENLVRREDILARAEDRRNLCRIMSWAHLYVSIRWAHTHLYIGIPSTVLAAAAGVQAIAELQKPSDGTTFAFYVLFSVLVAGLAPLLTFLNPMERADNHKSASRVYEQLGDAYDKFLLECIVNPRELISELEDLATLNLQYGELKKPLPITPEWAYQKALKQSENNQLVATFSHGYSFSQSREVRLSSSPAKN